MHTQYLAPHALSNLSSDAGESQPAMSKSVSYLLAPSSRSFGTGYTQVTNPQNTWGIRMLSGFPRVDKTNRRLTCLRALRAFAPFPCLPSWQHAAATTQVTLKNSWSLTRFRLPLSQPSTANTTKVVTLFPGQASAPASHHRQPRHTHELEAA